MRASKLAKFIKEDIEKWNKFLMTADKSIAGWGTVEEYLLDDFASDSKDDRKKKNSWETSSSETKYQAHKSKIICNNYQTSTIQTSK